MHRTFLNVIFIGLIFSSTACLMEFTRTLESSQRVAVGGIAIEEEIYRKEGFPDHRYERIYRVQTGWRTLELGRYTDEGTAGMTAPPLFVADWLVVMSGAHIFFWQEDEDVRHFYPYVVDEWVAYGQERQLNGHYDYAATNVQITGDRWWITYSCTACLASHPAMVRFVSTDGGQTFRLE